MQGNKRGWFQPSNHSCVDGGKVTWLKALGWVWGSCNWTQPECDRAISMHAAADVILVSHRSCHKDGGIQSSYSCRSVNSKFRVGFWLWSHFDMVLLKCWRAAWKEKCLISSLTLEGYDRLAFTRHDQHPSSPSFPWLNVLLKLICEWKLVSLEKCSLIVLLFV